MAMEPYVTGTKTDRLPSPEPKTGAQAADDKILEEARQRFHRSAEAEKTQRERILQAKRFRAGDQWDPKLKVAREGSQGIAGQQPQPARPCLVVDRLGQPVRQVSNTIKNADFGFDVLPNGGGADDETAEIIKGYLRRVQNNARGESPIEWGADGAIEGGIGWFRLRTEFVHQTWGQDTPTEELFDQELRMERITNNLSVYDDPSAMLPTRKDAIFKFVVEDMERSEAKTRWPDMDFASLDMFRSTGDADSWVGVDVLRIAEYWRITFTDRPFYWLSDGSVHEGKPPKGAQLKMARTMRVPKVEGYKITATEILERWDWLGSHIPLIPILGEELNVDGKPVLRGIIEPGMDAQRMVNYTYSAGIEIFALSQRKAPFVAAASIANYKNIWQTRAIYGYSFLPYDPFDKDGKPLPMPQHDTTEAPIQAAVELMRTSEDAIKASTSTGDASLGNTNPNERSGRALQSLQAQSDLANSNYPDNVRRAIIYAAEQMLEILPKITRPGQIWHILGMDDEPQQVMVGKPFSPGPNGTPQPAPAGVTPEMAKDPSTLYKFYDPLTGIYGVTVTVGKATSTKREEGAAALGELLPHLPPEMQAKIIPDYIKQLSFPGAQGIAEKLEPPSDQQGLPPQAQAMVQQLQQQLQQAQQAVQTDQVKVQGQIQIAQAKAQSDLKIAEMDNATKIAVARISAAKGALDAQAEAQEERLSTGLELDHEAQQNALDRAHEAGLAAQAAQHQGAAQQQAQTHEAQQATQQQGAQAAQQQQTQQASAEQSAEQRAHDAQQAEMARQAAAAKPPTPKSGT